MKSDTKELKKNIIIMKVYCYLSLIITTILSLFYWFTSGYDNLPIIILFALFVIIFYIGLKTGRRTFVRRIAENTEQSKKCKHKWRIYEVKRWWYSAVYLYCDKCGSWKEIGE